MIFPREPIIGNLRLSEAVPSVIYHAGTLTLNAGEICSGLFRILPHLTKWLSYANH